MPTLIDRDLYPEDNGGERKPNTFSVLIVLLVTAVVISYLIGYALPHALIVSDVLQPWPPYDDPRRRWMALSLFTILASYMGLWGFFRMLGAFQIRRIDAMARD
jgi:hypothetical protein